MQSTDDSPPHILDIIDRTVAERNAKRSDAVGQLVRDVLAAPDPDARLRDFVPALLRGYPWATRKAKITMLATALGADRNAFKAYLRAYALCGPAD